MKRLEELEIAKRVYHPENAQPLSHCGAQWRIAVVDYLLWGTKSMRKKTKAAPGRQKVGWGAEASIEGMSANRRDALGMLHHSWSRHLEGKTPLSGRVRRAKEGRPAYEGQRLPFFPSRSAAPESNGNSVKCK